MQFVCYQNGQFLSEVSLPPTTLGFTRSYAAFELFRTYNYVPFQLKEHLDRLKNSASILGIHYPENVEEVVEALLKKNHYKDLLVRIYLSEDEISGKSHFLALTGPIPTPPKEHYEQGIPVITTPLSRQFPLVKSTCYLSAIIALKEATKMRAEDALFKSSEGALLEFTKSNFFGVLDGTLYTAGDGVLLGITRNLVIQLAKKLSIPFQEKPLHYSALPSLQEAFSTSTTREVLPISHIDGIPIPLGPITKQLQKSFLILR